MAFAVRAQEVEHTDEAAFERRVQSAFALLPEPMAQDTPPAAAAAADPDPARPPQPGFLREPHRYVFYKIDRAYDATDAANAEAARIALAGVPARPAPAGQSRPQRRRQRIMDEHVVGGSSAPRWQRRARATESIPQPQRRRGAMSFGGGDDDDDDEDLDSAGPSEMEGIQGEDDENPGAAAAGPVFVKRRGRRDQQR